MIDDKWNDSYGHPKKIHAQCCVYDDAGDACIAIVFYVQSVFQALPQEDPGAQGADFKNEQHQMSSAVEEKFHKENFGFRVLRRRF